jgi:hypothetical protein
MHLCVPYGSQNKQQFFPYTALTEWSLEPRRCVYCAAWTESLNETRASFRLIQGVSHWSLTMEASVQSQAIPCTICGKLNGIGTDVSPCVSGFTGSIILPMLYTQLLRSSHTDKQEKPGNVPKSNALSWIGDKWISKYFHFLVLF